MDLPARPMVLATAWWLAAELVRRHPNLWVIETHPMDGHYDCLMLFDPDDHGALPIAQFNMTGHPASDAGNDDLTWSDVVASPDRRRAVIETIERSRGMASPSTTPKAQANSLSIRAVAAFLERSCLATHSHWEMANGFYDSSGMVGPDKREPLFLAMPAVAEHRAMNPRPAIGDIPSYRYWFLVSNAGRKETPRLAIDQVTGTAWSQDRSYDLMKIYDGFGRSLDRLVSEVFPEAF